MGDSQFQKAIEDLRLLNEVPLFVILEMNIEGAINEMEIMRIISRSSKRHSLCCLRNVGLLIGLVVAF